MLFMYIVIALFAVGALCWHWLGNVVGQVDDLIPEDDWIQYGDIARVVGHFKAVVGIDALSKNDLITYRIAEESLSVAEYQELKRQLIELGLDETPLDKLEFTRVEDHGDTQSTDEGMHMPCAYA